MPLTAAGFLRGAARKKAPRGSPGRRLSDGRLMSDIQPRTARPGPLAHPISHKQQLRVRYSETDQMGTVYHSRPLEWFECGRTELLRHLGLPYADLERQGLYLPLIESHLQYLGRARYDDL